MDLTALSDEALLCLARDGADERAYAAFVARTSSMVLMTAHRILGDRGLAEEAAQDAFLTAWLSLDRFDPAKGAARVWLRTITRRRAVDLHTRWGPHACADTHADRPSGEDPLDEIVHRTEQAGRMQSLVAALPAHQAEAIELVFLRELAVGEVAQHLGVPVSTVRGRVRMGLDRLERRLASHRAGGAMTT